MAERERELTPAGAAVQARLAELGRGQQWLADEMNRRREMRGNSERVYRATLWRWCVGASTMNVDDATLIESVLGVEATMWSQYHGELDTQSTD